MQNDITYPVFPIAIPEARLVVRPGSGEINRAIEPLLYYLLNNENVRK